MNELLTYLSLPFVRNALVCGILISLCASLLGTNLVLKKFSFIGDGLSHVAFGALAIATVLKVTSNLLVVMPITIISAIIILKLSSGKSKISGDSAIAMLSVSALAIGYLLLNIFPSNQGNIAADVCTSLFGSTNILTLNQNDVIISIILSAVTVLFFVLFYNKIFAVTFDEDFAKATGTNTNALSLLIAVIVAVVIVLAMNIVGSLLISALVIFPSITAMRIFKSFRSVTISAAVIAVFSSLFGILLSILIETPIGATIVALEAVLFLIFSIIGRFVR